MARKPTRPGKLRKWRVSEMRAKKVYIGPVTAPDKESAIDAAMAEFRVDPARRFKLIAEPME